MKEHDFILMAHVILRSTKAILIIERMSYDIMNAHLSR